MNYTAYLKQTRKAAGMITGAEFVSLAGGFYGLTVPCEGFIATLALDLDGATGWGAWREDADGERCCDDNYVEVGWLPLSQLFTTAARSLAAHKCQS